MTRTPARGSKPNPEKISSMNHKKIRRTVSLHTLGAVHWQDPANFFSTHRVIAALQRNSDDKAHLP